MSNLLVLSDHDKQARTAKFDSLHTPEKIAARAQETRTWAERFESAGLGDVYSQRNGSGNGAGFEARIAEAALMITWRGWDPDTAAETDQGTVAIPLTDLADAYDMPTVDDGALITRIDRIFTDLADVTVLIREAHTTKHPARYFVEDIDRKIVVHCPHHTANGTDRVAVLDLRFIVEDNDSTGLHNAWRPEYHTGWAESLLPA